MTIIDLKTPDVSTADLNGLRRSVRASIIDLAATATGCHIGGCLSVADILIAAFSCSDLSAGDEVILSKGHAAAGLYAVMHRLGLMLDDPVPRYGAKGSILTGHPNHKIPGVRFSTGSLGHGIAYGVGWALGAKMKCSARRAIVIAGDGELQEGLCWEAFQLASAQALRNFVVVVDRNGGQNDGAVDDISPLSSLMSRFESFGFDAVTVDGHDVPALMAALQVRQVAMRPLAVIANTVKGQGVAAIAGKSSCHYAVLRSKLANQWKEDLV